MKNICCWLMSNESVDIINLLSKYIYDYFKLREGLVC